jgi:hypothetical protein
MQRSRTSPTRQGMEAALQLKTAELSDLRAAERESEAVCLAGNGRVARGG